MASQSDISANQSYFSGREWTDNMSSTLAQVDAANPRANNHQIAHILELFEFCRV